jgi:hypothetical protein
MWKVLVLLAGLTGVVGFFLPLRSYASADGTVSAQASAYQVVSGLGDATELLAQAQKLGMSKADAERIAKTVNQAMESYRAAMIVLFAPSALLVLVGLVGLARGRTGRFAGMVAFVLGLASIVAAVLILMLVGDLEIQHRTVSLTLGGSSGAGMYCLLGAGAVGAFAGLGAMLRPGP